MADLNAKSIVDKENCNLIVKNLMPYAANAIYVQKYFPKSSHDAVVEIIDKIFKTLKNKLNANDWLNSDKKKILIDKVNIN